MLPNYQLTAYHKSERMRNLCFLECDDPAECKCRRPLRIVQTPDEDLQEWFDRLDCRPNQEQSK